MGAGHMEEVDIKKLRLLVIDDQSFARKLIVRLLEEIGVEMVSSATDGVNGLKLLEAGPKLIE